MADRPPLVLAGTIANTQRLSACCERAGRLGLAPGLGLAAARAMHPGIEVLPAEPESDSRFLRHLAHWATRFTPLVGLDGPDGLFLDIAGCAHLFGGEQGLMTEAVTRAGALGLAVQAGLASTVGTAFAAARLRPGAMVGPGTEEAFLAPLPLSALRLEGKAEAGLRAVGLSTVGRLAAQPRAAIARRFGSAVIARLDSALGRAGETVSPLMPVADLSAERRLAEPAVLTEQIEEITLGLARALKPALEARGRGARRLELALWRTDGAVRRLSVGTARPLRDPQAIRNLFRERLAALDGTLETGCGFEILRLSVLASAAFEESQRDLAGDPREGSEAVAAFAERAMARLGPQALLAPALHQTHCPERAAALVPFVDHEPASSRMASGSLASARHGPAAPRPIRLFGHPEPVDAISGIPDGPPASFRWRRVHYRVARAEGPERIAPEWWREPAATPVRDYWRVEDETGRRFWLYRAGFHEGSAPARWFLHGLFA
ncbi:DUF6504 family protein [Zhengella mangrovi]|uniref:DUF6504 family protein n=1 Tax=Zhengella mangrovi TaxID=1982044 RepID=UPI002683B69A